MTDYVDVPKSSSAKDTVLAYSVTIPSKSTHNYTIEINYLNDEENSQNIDMNSILSGNIYITKYTLLSLVEAMLRDNPTVSERTNFSFTNVADTTGTIYMTNKTEDGSVRLLYSGTSHNTISGYIGESSFNEDYDESRYVGYMYGENTSLEDNRTNTTDSTIKTYIDTWYQNNLLANYDIYIYISNSAIYCNDRNVVDVGSGTWVNTGNTFYYGIDLRSFEGFNAISYKCGADTSGGLFETTQAVQDKFSSSTNGGGNGKLTYPIALMTADEIVFAGGRVFTSLSSPYAYYYINSMGSSITGSTYWWLLSPCLWSSDGYSAVTYVGGSDFPGGLSYGNVDISFGIRGIVSLDSCAKVTGTGALEDPYIIDEENSTC